MKRTKIQYHNVYLNCPRCLRRVTVSVPRVANAYCMKCRDTFDIQNADKAEYRGFKRQI